MRVETDLLSRTASACFPPLLFPKIPLSLSLSQSLHPGPSGEVGLESPHFPELSSPESGLSEQADTLPLPPLCNSTAPPSPFLPAISAPFAVAVGDDTRGGVGWGSFFSSPSHREILSRMLAVFFFVDGPFALDRGPFIIIGGRPEGLLSEGLDSSDWWQARGRGGPVFDGQP